MKPIIGVTSLYSVNENNYIQKISSRNLNAVLNSGGIPVVLPVTCDESIIDDILEKIDGIVFTGGGDISPLIYGSDPIKGLREVSTPRDEFEFILYKKAEILDMPMLGICRGVQVMNVASGGTLYQDIYIEREGCNDHSPSQNEFIHKYHSVDIISGTKLSNIFGDGKLGTNTSHHQAIKTLGKNYIVSAKASDGIIEAIESKTNTFALGVQWHPEALYERYAEFSKLYDSLVEEANKFFQRKFL